VSAPSIPFLDLAIPHRELEQELTAVFQQALRTAAFIGGPMVENFENAFAAFCQTKHAIAVSSGTDALRFALLAAGVKAGDVVITVPNTFIATTEAISHEGALPGVVDVAFRHHHLGEVRRRRRTQLQHVSSETARVFGDAMHRIGRRSTGQQKKRPSGHSNHPGTSLRADG
jgi:O-acetylhomoserine/O-acetylserine sulfhydrylase-like pyridoxal-dependent enzyme